MAFAEPHSVTSNAKVTYGKVASGQARMVGEVNIRDLEKAAPSAAMQHKTFQMPTHIPPNLPQHKASQAAVDQFQKLLKSQANQGQVLGPGQLQPTRHTSFQGISSIVNDEVLSPFGEVTPPDQGLAVFNNTVAEINNFALQFFDAKAGAPITTPIGLDAFFLNPTPGGDPQAFFDSSANRWYFTEINTNVLCINGEAPPCTGVDVAVSKTANPLGAYTIYHVDLFSQDLATCSGSSCFPDFPHDGINKDCLFVSVNLFGVGGVQAGIYCLPKSQLLAAKAVKPIRFVGSPNDSFTIQPSVIPPGTGFDTRANDTEWFWEDRELLAFSDTIRLWAVFNTKFATSNPALLGSAFLDVPVEFHGCSGICFNGVNPALEPAVLVPGGFCAATSGLPVPALNADFVGFLSTIQYSGGTAGSLTGALHFGAVDASLTPVDFAAWFALAPTITLTSPTPPTVTLGATVIRGFPGDLAYIIPPLVGGYSIIYPAVGLDKTTGGIIGFSITNGLTQAVPGGYPSAAVVDFSPLPTGAPLFPTIFVTGQGQNADDDFTGCGNALPGGRWGDYGAATVDAKTGNFFAANENISGPRGFATNWGTWITEGCVHGSCFAATANNP